MFALIGMILALVFVIVALFGPWYEMSSTGNTASMSLTSTTGSSGGTTVTTSHADSRKQVEAVGGDAGVFDVFNIALYLTIFSLVIAILALVFLLGYVFNFGKPAMMKNLAMIFGIITFILALVAIIYFMVAFPGKLGDSYSIKDVGFWDSKTILSTTVSFGPGFAWYLMIVAGIIALISSLFVFMNKSVAPVYQKPAP